ncbi:MAG TPA: cell envelope integrity protein TolA [Methylophilus sp.]
MIRKHESTVSWKAGILAIAVHGVLFIAMMVSINWKAAHPIMNVAEVELWDKVPTKNTAEPEQVKEQPKPEIKPPPQPEPKPEIKETPKPEPKPDESDAEIALEKKKKDLAEKAKLDQQKELEKQKQLDKEKALAKLKQDMRDEELKADKAAEKKQQEALKKIQQAMLSEEDGQADKAASSANASLVSEFKAKIIAKIRGNVNKTLCGDGNPEVRFDINVLPTGDLSGQPKLVRSSGNTACDEAVERAIMASEPLPLPAEPSAKAQFRNLNLTFRPNN